MKGKQPITLEKMYNQFTLFFFGTFSVIILSIYDGNFIKNPFVFVQNLNHNPISLILIEITFICYFSNIILFSIYYLTKFSKVARETYPKYRFYYLGGIIFIFIMMILIFGYLTLGLQKLSENLFSTLLLGGLASISWLFKEFYNSKYKKRKKLK